MANASDTFMELSDPSVWGETLDEKYGMGPGGRQLGAFEISSFTLEVGDDTSATPGGAKTPGAAAPGAAAPGAAAPGAAAPGKTAAATNEKPTFSVAKYIDKASSDLFVACRKKTNIAWCIISFRESGEMKRVPYLVLEFRDLHVVKFGWELRPGEADSAASMETVTFNFEQILIKYSRQEPTGEHRVVKMKGWNYDANNDTVSELDSELQAQNQETASDF